MAGYLRERVAAARIADLEAAVTSQGKRVRDLEAALREIAACVPNAGDLASQPVGIARAVLVGETAGRDAVNYTGTDASVECAYPPCRNRLRYADFGPQFCSKEHRRLAAVSSPGRSER